MSATMGSQEWKDWKGWKSTATWTQPSSAAAYATYDKNQPTWNRMDDRQQERERTPAKKQQLQPPQTSTTKKPKGEQNRTHTKKETIAE